MSWKNSKAGGNFIPAIKILKHLISKFDLNVISFYIECFLFTFPDSKFSGGPADYITSLLAHIVSYSSLNWRGIVLETPCQDRNIFAESEWDPVNWSSFYEAVIVWAKCAQLANQAEDREQAVKCWKLLLGDDFFPRQVS